MVLLLVCLAWALKNNVKIDFFDLPDHIRQKFYFFEMKLLASFLVLSRAEFSVPLGVIPGNTNDCLKDGNNQCIECIGCTYFTYNGEDQGAS